VPPLDPQIRQLRSPLTREQLLPLDPRCRVVQFSRPLAPDEYPRVSSFLQAYPDVPLRIYGHEGMETDLEFLREFPRLQQFQVNVYNLVSFDGLRHLPPTLTYLGLGQTKSKRHSLSILSRFPALTELFIEGHTKGFEAVGTLQQLRTVTLRSITLPGLDILTGLPELRSLDIKLGGTNNLTRLTELTKLRYLELWMVRGLTNLDPVTSLANLQYLYLQALKNVTTLPSFRPLARLRRVHLETMKGLRDLQAVADAPTLEELLVVDMPRLTPEAFRPLVGHPRLKSATIGLGSARKNQAAEELLGVPPAGRFDREFVFEE
jgi:hypothetical protein